MHFPAYIAASSSYNLIYAFWNSDGLGKAVVMVLLALSVVSWVLMVEKWTALRKSHTLSEDFLGKFHENTKGLLKLANQTSDSPVSAVYEAGMEQVLGFYEDALPGSTMTAGLFTKRGISRAPVKLTDVQLGAIEAVLSNAVSKQIAIIDSNLVGIGTIVSLSPFLGLFGTVWGVMMAFCGIAQAGKSDFTALAPGVAGALLTTVAGLFVAIPSMIGYNMITNSIRRQTVMVEDFSDQFLAQLKLEQGSADVPDSQQN